MSNLIGVNKKCSCCEKESEQIVVLSTNTFGGSSDLDLRPPEMKRSTMPYWVQMCPYCQYVAEDIEKVTLSDKSILQKKEYKECSNIKFTDDISKKFYRYYLISQSKGDIEKAFNGVRNAVWACDDVRNDLGAKACRELAIKLLSQLIKDEKDINKRETMLCVKADMLRRTKKFDELIDEYSNFIFNGEIIKKVIAFELVKSREKDSRRYEINDAIEKYKG